MQIHLISDTHFGHANILRFLKADGTRIRPEFTSVEEMDEAMVERWNKVVQISDHVYHLGDVVIKANDLQIVKRLNGHKRLIRGNHDIFKTRLYIAAGFQEILGCRVLANVLMTHFPIHETSMGHFLGNAHGHIHQNASPPGPYLNLSVERIDYTPVALDEVVKRLKNLKETLNPDPACSDRASTYTGVRAFPLTHGPEPAIFGGSQ